MVYTSQKFSFPMVQTFGKENKMGPSCFLTIGKQNFKALSILMFGIQAPHCSFYFRIWPRFYAKENPSWC